MELENFNLAGKTALITGVAGMLGNQHAMAILEVVGSVLITDLDFDKLHSASAALCGSFNKEKIDAYVMVVTDEGSVKGLSNTLCTRGIRIGVLINNAAIDPKVNNENVISESSDLRTLN